MAERGDVAFEARIDQLQKDLPLLLKEAGIKLEEILQGYIASDMTHVPPSDDWLRATKKDKVKPFPPEKETWSDSSTLRKKTGRLIESFLSEDEETLTKLNLKNDGIDFTFGSKLPYASILNTGGFIKSKGYMHKHFWKIYYKHKTLFHKAMALSVMKRGGVTIPKFGYYSKGIEAFKTKGYNKWLEKIMDRIGALYA